MYSQDVTEENAELALGVKANKGLVPRAAQLPSKSPDTECSNHHVVHQL